MTLYSQNDPKWKNIKIGKSSSPIGRWGCTLTCVGMLVDVSPADVNGLLTPVGGFTNDLIVWSAVHKAFQRLTYVRRGKTADLAYIESFVDKYGGCLVEVDFDGVINTPADFHWVVYRREGKLWDPWDGKEYPRSKYKIVKGYSSFEIAKTDIVDMYNVNIIDDMPQWLRTMFLELGVDLNKAEGEIRFRVQEVIDGFKKFKELEVRIDDLKKKWEESEGALKEAQVKAKNDLDTIATLKIRVDELEKSIVNRDAEMQKLRDRVEVLEKQMDPERVVLVTKDEYVRLVASDGLRGASWVQRLLSLFGVFPSK